MALGKHSRVKGLLGCVIVGVELGVDGKIVATKAALVDGEKIKENTWYRLENGEFVEAE